MLRHQKEPKLSTSSVTVQWFSKKRIYMELFAILLDWGTLTEMIITFWNMWRNSIYCIHITGSNFVYLLSFAILYLKNWLKARLKKAKWHVTWLSIGTVFVRCLPKPVSIRAVDKQKFICWACARSYDRQWLFLSIAELNEGFPLIKHQAFSVHQADVPSYLALNHR